jgi:hypothetical protein
VVVRRQAETLSPAEGAFSHFFPRNALENSFLSLLRSCALPMTWVFGFTRSASFISGVNGPRALFFVIWSSTLSTL